LPEMPSRTIPITANTIESGIADATINAARIFPKIEEEQR
jgi:hypothetical protein